MKKKEKGIENTEMFFFQKKSSFMYYMAGCGRVINGQRPDYCLQTRANNDIREIKDSLTHALKNIEAERADFVGEFQRK